MAVKKPIEGEMIKINNFQNIVFPGHNKKQKITIKIDINLARKLNLAIADILTVRINSTNINFYVDQIIPIEIFDIISSKPVSFYLSDFPIWKQFEKQFERLNPISMKGDFQKVAKKLLSITSNAVVVDLNYYSDKIKRIWQRIFITTNLLNTFLTAFFVLSLIYIQINKHPSRMYDLKIISTLGASREQCKQYYTKEALWELRIGFLFSFLLTSYLIQHSLKYLKLNSSVSIPALIFSVYLLMEVLTRAFIKFFMNTTFDHSSYPK